MSHRTESEGGVIKPSPFVPAACNSMHAARNAKGLSALSHASDLPLAIFAINFEYATDHAIRSCLGILSGLLKPLNVASQRRNVFGKMLICGVALNRQSALKQKKRANIIFTLKMEVGDGGNTPPKIAARCKIERTPAEPFRSGDILCNLGFRGFNLRRLCTFSPECLNFQPFGVQLNLFKDGYVNSPWHRLKRTYRTGVLRNAAVAE